MSKAAVRQEPRPMQVFSGFLYNGFALTGTAVNTLERGDLIRFVSTVEEVNLAEPLIFPIPTHYLWNCRPKDGEDGYIFKLLDEGAQEFFKLPNLVLCLDAAGEGFPLDALSFDHMAERLAGYGLSAERVLFLNSDLRSPQRYAQWCQQNDRKPAFTPVPFDVQLYYYAGGVRQFRRQFEELFYAGLAQDQAELEGRRKKYLSFNYTPRPTRLGIVLTLMEGGLLDDGFVSFHGRSVDNGPLDSPAWADPAIVHGWLKSLDLPDRAIELLPALDEASPILLDTGSDRVSMAYGKSDTEYYLQSYYSIITETVFEGPETEFRFTEKTWKAVAHCHPFVLIANPGALAELRSQGFKTFHPLIDESYDEVSDPGQRFACIRKEVFRLGAMSRQELGRLYRELWPAISHNFTLFHFGAGELLKRDLTRIVVDAAPAVGLGAMEGGSA